MVPAESNFFIFATIFIVVAVIFFLVKVIKARNSSIAIDEETVSTSENRGRGHRKSSSLLVLFSALFIAQLFLILPYLAIYTQTEIDVKGTVTVFLLLCLLLVSIVLSIMGRGLELDD